MENGRVIMLFPSIDQFWHDTACRQHQVNHYQTYVEDGDTLQNGVVYIAADMQTQSNASGDKEYPIASQHDTIVVKDAINEEKNSSASGASK